MCFCNFRELKFAIYFEGWLLIVPQKYHEASEFVYNSGFFITTNKYPNFGEGRDGEAIKRRLEIFQTKIIPSLVIVLHIWIIDCKKKFGICFFYIPQALHFPSQYSVRSIWKLPLNPRLYSFKKVLIFAAYIKVL